MRFLSVPLLLGLFSLSACKPEPRILEGHVTDVFGHPIPGATVLAEGWQGRAATDDSGTFKLEVETSGDVRFVAGAEGFVRDQMTATIPPVEEEEAPLPAVSFSLWPKPDHVGFYGKGPDKLIEVGPTKVIALGSDLTEIHGVRDILNVELPKADPNEFLFMSTIRASEISQLDLKIHKLRYQESVPFKAITGEEMIEPKFWVADVEIPFTLRGLYADDMFVIKTDAPLPPEVYAFVHQGILTKTDPGSLERFPAEQREVFPFEIK